MSDGLMRDWRGVCVACGDSLGFIGIPVIAMECGRCASMSHDDEWNGGSTGCYFGTGIKRTSLSDTPLEKIHSTRHMERFWSGEAFDSPVCYLCIPYDWIRSEIARESGTSNVLYRYEKIFSIYYNTGRSYHPLRCLVLDYVHNSQCFL